MNTTHEYLLAVAAAVASVNPAAVDRLTTLLSRAMLEGRVLLVGGNGGSLATVMHFATDLEKCVQAELLFDQQHFPFVPRVHVLGGNTSVLTAWANDDSWNGALAAQVRAWGEPGGALFLLSASGRSPNLLAAAKAGRDAGLTVVALIGRAGSPLAALADEALEMGTEDIQTAEDVHHVLCHAIFRHLRRIDFHVRPR